MNRIFYLLFCTLILSCKTQKTIEKEEVIVRFTISNQTVYERTLKDKAFKDSVFKNPENNSSLTYFSGSRDSLYFSFAIPISDTVELLTYQLPGSNKVLSRTIVNDSIRRQGILAIYRDSLSDQLEIKTSEWRALYTLHPGRTDNKFRFFKISDLKNEVYLNKATLPRVVDIIVSASPVMLE